MKPGTFTRPCPACEDGRDPLYADPSPCPCCGGACEVTYTIRELGPGHFEYVEHEPQVELFEEGAAA